VQALAAHRIPASQRGIQRVLIGGRLGCRVKYETGDRKSKSSRLRCLTLLNRHSSSAPNHTRCIPRLRRRNSVAASACRSSQPMSSARITRPRHAAKDGPSHLIGEQRSLEQAASGSRPRPCFASSFFSVSPPFSKSRFLCRRKSERHCK